MTTTEKILLPYRAVLAVPFFAAVFASAFVMLLAQGPARARRYLHFTYSAVLASE